MRDTAPRIAAAIALLAVLWIVVYWSWPADPPVSFDDAPPDEPPEVAVVPSPTPAPPPAPVQPQPRPTPQPTPPPTPQPAPPPLVTPPEFEEYTIREGDTFATIARRRYGRADLADAIARANPLMDPNRLRVGRVIRLPKDPANIQGTPRPDLPDPAPPNQPPAERTYTVQPGDTLSGIAKTLYDDSRLATFLFEANRDVLTDEHSLKVGQRLRVPPRPPQREPR